MKSNDWRGVLTNVGLVGLDSMVFIYQFARAKRYFELVNQVFDLMEKGKLEAVTSLVSFIEVVSLPALHEKEELLRAYKEVFLRTPNLKMVNPDMEIAEKAAELRRVYKLRTPDALQVATALTCGAKALITNDGEFKKMQGIEVWLLEDWT
jgi:predicted nucleic acid-binding protein